MNKTRQKLSIVALMIAVIVCFTAAILGLTAMPSAKVSADNTHQKIIVNYTNTNAAVGETIVTKEAPAEGATKVTLIYKAQTISGFPMNINFYATDGTTSGSSRLYLGNGTEDMWKNDYGKEGTTYEIVYSLTENKVYFNGTSKNVDAIQLDKFNHFGLLFQNNDGFKCNFEMYAFDDTGKELGVIGLSGAGWVTDQKLNVPEDEKYLTTCSNGDYEVVSGSTTSWNVALSNVFNATEEDGVVHLSKRDTSSNGIGIRFGRTLTAKNIANGAVMIIRLKYASDSFHLKYGTIDGWNQRNTSGGNFELRDYVENGDANSTNGFVDYVISNDALKNVFADADGEVKGIQFAMASNGTYGDVYIDYVKFDYYQKVTFISEGEELSVVSVANGSTVTAPADPTKDGHYFVGWFTEETFENKFDLSTTIDKDITLYAKFAQATVYKLVSKATIYDSNKNNDINRWMTAEAPSENATKVTIKFKTIARDSVGRHAQMLVTDGTTNETSQFHGAYQFNNSWSPIGDTVTYEYDLVNKSGKLIGNDGKTTIMNITWTGNPTQFGSLWYMNTSMRGLSALFEITAADDMGKDLGVTATTDGLSVTTGDVYKITVNANNGTTTTDYVLSGTVYSEPTVIKENHIFKGWYINEGLTTAYDFSQAVNSDITLYAKWELNEFTVSFDTDGGTAVDAQTVQYNGKATVPAEPTKDGYYFDGWYVVGLTDKYDFDALVTADITVYAKWISFDAYYANIVSTGAPSIRINEKTTSGIRFATAVDNDLLAQLTAEGYTYTVGTLIVPFDYVGANAPTMELLDSEGKGYYNIVSTFDGTTDVFYGTLQSLRESNYGRKWVGLGYVAIDMGDDGVKYIYAAYDQANALSIYDVAEDFFNKYEDDENEIENVEIAKYYIDSVVALDASYAVVDKATDTEIPYEVAIVENVVTITVKEGYDFVIKSVVIDGKIAKVDVAVGGKSATYQIA